MTKLTLIFTAAALAPAALFAQTPAGASNFQQPGWMRLPGSGGTPFSIDTLVGQSGPVVGKPLTADEVHTNVQTLSDGSHIENTETDHFYRDSQGRMRTETASGAVIYDPIAGVTYDLTFGSKSYTKGTVKAGSNVTIMARAHQSGTTSWSSSSTGSHPAGAEHRQTRNGQEQVTEDLSPTYVNGIYAKGSRVTVSIPTGAIGNDRDLKVVNERWYSDDLKVLLKSSNADPRFGTTTYELKNITQVEPDSSLFQVPADYKFGH